MSLLGPFSIALWKWVAVGGGVLVIGAYIIKMRRRRFEVPFAALWKKVLETKDANSLWKQLKRLISLLLALAILGLILFSVMDPTLGAVQHDARNVVVLLDASASMKTMDGNPDGKQSRLDAAKQRAKDLVDSMGGGDVAMIMRVDGQATPMSRFTGDGPMLDKIIDGIQASDTPADLTRALGAAADALRSRNNPLVVLVSDGAFPEAALGLVTWDANKPAAPPPPPKAGEKVDPTKAGEGIKNLAAADLTGIDVRYLPVGRRSDNVGIIAFNVRRYIANKAAYEVYIEVQNFGTEPAHRQLALYNGDTAVDVKPIDLAPGQRLRQIYPKLPGSVDNKLRASLRPVDGKGGSDAFALDDQAFALLPVRKKQKVLMVTQDNLFLEGALLIYDNIDALKITPAEYEQKPSYADDMDVVVFDDYTPAVVPPPPVSLLYFHPTGPNSPIAVSGEINAPKITELDENHPVMRWISMADVYMDKSNVFAPDAKKGEQTLAWSVRSSLIAAKRDGRRKILAVGFSLPSVGRDSATDLPLRVAFPMMLVNALDWFAGDQSDLLTTYSTGSRERVPLDGVTGASEAEVTGPDGAVTRTPVLDGLATFYGSRVGYYDLAVYPLTTKAPTDAGSGSGSGSVKPTALAHVELAANLASPSESDIAPSSQLTLGGQQLKAPEKFAISHSKKLWIYLVLLAMVLVVLEWVTYHRRITV